jgi:hypothetical protein
MYAAAHRRELAPLLRRAAPSAKGRETYYWALFDLPPHQLGQPVMSYAQFLRAGAGDGVSA